MGGGGWGGREGASEHVSKQVSVYQGKCLYELEKTLYPTEILSEFTQSDASLRPH